MANLDKPIPPLPVLSPAAHVPTSAVMCVVSSDGVLILRRGHTSPWRPLTWCLPGGELNKGETALHAAVRELREETGLIAHDPRPLGASYHVTTPGGDNTSGQWMEQAFICTCENVSVLGRSSAFPGGLPVCPDLGIPENDAWCWCTGADVGAFELSTNDHLVGIKAGLTMAKESIKPPVSCSAAAPTPAAKAAGPDPVATPVPTPASCPDPKPLSKPPCGAVFNVGGSGAATVRFVFTCFGPFPGCPVNPTEELLHCLPAYLSRHALGCPALMVSEVRLGCKVKDDVDALEQMYRKYGTGVAAKQDGSGKTASAAPIRTVFIHLGVYQSTKRVRVEVSAFNHAALTTEDRGLYGTSADGSFNIEPMRPSTYTLVTNLPVKSMLKRILSVHPTLPLCGSCDAGRYYCNLTYYQSLRHTQFDSCKDALFVHIPTFESVDKQTQLRCVREIMASIVEHRDTRCSADESRRFAVTLAEAKKVALRTKHSAALTQLGRMGFDVGDVAADEVSRILEQCGGCVNRAVACLKKVETSN